MDQFQSTRSSQTSTRNDTWGGKLVEFQSTRSSQTSTDALDYINGDVGISIHEVFADLDPEFAFVIGSSPVFQSTRPSQTSTFHVSFSPPGMIISIHEVFADLDMCSCHV